MEKFGAQVYIKRAIESIAMEISNSFPVLMVTGPRQVGKSTLLEHLAQEDRTVVSLDDLTVRKLAKEDPDLFMQRYQPPLMIDEIQYAPELFSYIKQRVDQSKANGGYWLTGSQSFRKMKGVSESLAGRVGILDLLGLSQNEIRGSASAPFTTEPKFLIERAETLKPMDSREVFERIFLGSMPRLYLADAPGRGVYYESYLRTYIQRDVSDLAQVGDELQFQTFMTVAAARTAKPIIYEELANEVGVSAPTAKKWLSILQTSGLVAIVPPYHNNLLKRATKMPLLHFLDTGLAAYLLGWDSAITLERGAMAGAFFESHVFAEIYKSYINSGMKPPLFYYRDKEKREIDILIYQNGTLYPIEVKKSASPGKEAIKHFEALKGLTNGEIKIGTGCAVCMASDVLPIDDSNWRVPVWVI